MSNGRHGRLERFYLVTACAFFACLALNSHCRAADNQISPLTALTLECKDIPGSSQTYRWKIVKSGMRKHPIIERGTCLQVTEHTGDSLVLRDKIVIERGGASVPVVSTFERTMSFSGKDIFLPSEIFCSNAKTRYMLRSGHDYDQTNVALESQSCERLTDSLQDGFVSWNTLFRILPLCRERPVTLTASGSFSSRCSWRFTRQPVMPIRSSCAARLRSSCKSARKSDTAPSSP